MAENAMSQRTELLLGSTNYKFDLKYMRPDCDPNLNAKPPGYKSGIRGANSKRATTNRFMHG